MSGQTLQHLLNVFILSLVAGVPLLLAAGCCLSSLQRICFRLLPWSPLPALLTVLFSPAGIKVHVDWFFMGSTMGFDAVGRIFLSLTACIWLLAALAVYEKFKHEDVKRFRFAGFFLASMSGNFGLILARDILGFYLFFALMSFSAYGLIIHNRTKEAVKAGRVYLMLVFLSELAMFTALVILSSRGVPPSPGIFGAEGMSTALVLLLFIAFGVKIGALPFQSWMVLSYQEAPVPAATALAGAMVNAGIIGWLRFFPFGQVVLPGGAVFLILIGTAAAFYGVFFGLYQEKIGRVLASSSMSQMGLVTCIAGYGLMSNDGGSTALLLMTLFAVHHSLAKTSLFLGYDLVDRGGRLTTVILAAGLLVPCLSLAGLPLTSGAMLKGGMKDLAAGGHGPWSLFGKIFLPLSSMGTTILMLHCVRLLRLRHSKASGNRAASAVVLWAASVAAVLAVPWLWPPLRNLGGHSLNVHALLQALWPVTLGTVLALGWFATGCRLPGRGLATGDSDYVIRKVYDGFVYMLTALTDWLDNMNEAIKAARLLRWFSPTFTSLKGLGRWETVIGRWSVVGLLYLLICLLLFMLMLFWPVATAGT